jgi:hypothetical protein
MLEGREILLPTLLVPENSEPLPSLTSLLIG